MMQKVTQLPVNSRIYTGDGAKAEIKQKESRRARSVNGGRWTPGQSGNLSGRPVGSGNLTYKHFHSLLLEKGEEVVAAVLAAAIRGDSIAQRLVMDRILPRRVCNPIRDVTLPPLRIAGDAALALGEITAAVLDGRITADEAASLASIVEVFIKVAASLDHERRIVELEERAKERQ
jgi:hypothetical protein